MRVRTVAWTCWLNGSRCCRLSNCIRRAASSLRILINPAFLVLPQVEACRNIRAGSECRLTCRFQTLFLCAILGRSTSTGCLITVFWHIHAASDTEGTAYSLSLEHLSTHILFVRSLLAITTSPQARSTLHDISNLPYTPTTLGLGK